MFKMIGICFTLFCSTEGFALVRKLDQVPPAEKSVTDQVKVEVGGRILIEQFFAREKKYNTEDSYTLNFLCKKKSKSKTADCTIVDYKILSKQSSSQEVKK